MRFALLCTIFAGLASAQASDSKAAPNPRDVKLVGDRFKPLTYDQMTPAQKTMIEHVVNGERRGAGGPFNVMLRSPEMGDLAQALGAYARYHADMPAKLRELAILITARYWTVQFEWQAHHRAALQAGLSPQICDAIAAGKRPASMNPDEAAVYNFGTELLNTKQVSDATFQAAVKTLGEKGVVDLMGLMGYYQIVAMMLNVDRYPLPEGVKAELAPLK
jgi:4-carboxymuconolactone decarboxylase